MKQRARPALRHLEEELQRLEDAQLLRRRPNAAVLGERSFCSNDYLGLASTRVEAHAAPGAGASRLIAGEHAEHQELERSLAAWLGLEAALVFTSGYAANVGLVSAVAGRGDLVVSDERNHASIIDGIRLSRADVEIVPHLDVAATERALARHAASAAPGRRWVVTEGYFSMDADSPDLRVLRALCDRYEAALLVDEAHSLGVLGPDGRGVCAEQNVEPDAIIGTFGKAFGAGGAFVAGPAVLVDWLWNRARSFVFSTGLSPVVAALALAGVRTAIAKPELRSRTAAAAARLRSGLAEAGVTALGYGHIIPVVLGDPAAALRISHALAARGIRAQAIRPPTVAPGTSRLRLAASARHSEEDLVEATLAFAEVFRGTVHR